MKLQEKRLFLLDIDGTIALDMDLVDGTMDFMQHVLDIGGKYIFITNNSTKGIPAYLEKFSKWHIPVDASNFVTSGTATIAHLQEHYAQQKIFCVGTRSFINDMREAGLTVTEALEPDIICAVVGFDNELTYDKAYRLCQLLQTQTVDYLATNPDLACPTVFGFVPDCGAICNFIRDAIGRLPQYIGKPNRSIVDACLAQTGFSPEQTLVIGDRLYTDIACGINAGVDTAVVFTGEAQPEDLATTDYPPTYAFPTMRELYEALL